MNTKKKAFTLVELLAVVAISAILLFIATDRLIGDSFKANATYNQRVDVQTGVKTSMENIKSILKRSVQVHLVGKEVYMEDMNLQRLDHRYNYIAFRKDANGNRFLANIVYDKASRKFNVLPLTAGDKKDIMTGDKIDYNLEFYKNDNNYRKKLENDMLNITITGKSSANVLGKAINDEFQLKEDIQLPNVNQILLSRHLQGGIDKITALAYDNAVIQPGKKGSGGKVGFVLILDSSASMKFNMVDPYDARYRAYPFKKGPNRYQLGYYNRYQGSDGKWYWGFHRNAVRPEVYTESDIQNPKSVAATRKVVLGGALNNTLLPMFHNLAVTKNLDVEAYIFDYNYGLQDYSTNRNTFDIANPTDYSTKYFTTLDMARRRGYGPLKLETSSGLALAKDLVLNKANMKIKLDEHDRWGPAYGQATNTGLGLLTGLEILQQMKDKGIDKRYMVLLTDGVPTIATTIKNKTTNTADSRAYYNSVRGNQLDFSDESWREAMAYIRRLTNAGTGNNPKGLYDKAYLIGFSGVPSEISRLGVPNPNIPSDSINAYLRQTGNETMAIEAKDSNKLEEAFQTIVNDIGVSLGVFDGPDRMK